MLVYAKAIVSALIAGLTALGTALLDGRITAGEWVAVTLAFFAALSATYATPNRKAKA